MKRKFLILTLCFTLIFTNINYKKSYADSGLISLPILATVSSLAVATGISLSTDDDLYDIGRLFYDYIDRHNDLTWDSIKALFNSSVVLLNNKLVSVDSKFLDIVNGFFDNTFDSSINNQIGTYQGVPYVGSYPYYSLREQMYNKGLKVDSLGSDFTIGLYHFRFNNIDSAGSYSYTLYYNSSYLRNISFSPTSSIYFSVYNISDISSEFGKLNFGYVLEGYQSPPILISQDINFDISIPYNDNYTWDHVENKKENDSIALPIPGDLGQLVGQGSTDFWANTDNLVGTGGISIPTVDNPSISVDNTDSFPKVEDIPDVDIPGQDTIVPSFPSFGDSLDFSPMYLTNVTEKFPFSLPWDIGRLIQKFDVEPVAPVFEVPMVSETIMLDLTEFSELASIVRFFVLICFILSLIFISTKLLG